MKLSVVMSVFNGAAQLRRTLDSILGQSESDFELIAIDDGSADDTLAILHEYASRDARVRVLTQPNAGLTRSLIRGCAAARADVIARHDCGDRSHPDRFARQLKLIENGATVASCTTRFVDEDGDLLYITHVDGEEVWRSLREDDASAIHGLPHGTAMFRRDAYLLAGGYRAQFRVAQDLDLWIRIARDGGTFASTDDVLYDALISTSSISGTSRAAQVRMTEIAVALRDGRGSLADAAEVKPQPMTPRGEAAALYFIAKCLLRQGNRKGLRLLAEVTKRDPRHWRAWATLLAERLHRRQIRR